MTTGLVGSRRAACKTPIKRQCSQHPMLSKGLVVFAHDRHTCTERMSGLSLKRSAAATQARQLPLFHGMQMQALVLEAYNSVTLACLC